MPALESALVAILNAAPAVTAVLGSPTRLYPDAIPIGATYPAATFQRVATVRRSEKLRTPKPAPATTQLTRTIVQITVVARTAATRSAVSEAIRASLVGIHRELWAGVLIASITVPDGERDTHTGETQLFERQTDYAIWFNET